MMNECRRMAEERTRRTDLFNGFHAESFLREFESLHHMFKITHHFDVQQQLHGAEDKVHAEHAAKLKLPFASKAAAMP